MGIYTTKGMKTEMMCEGEILCHIHVRIYYISYFVRVVILRDIII